MLNVLCRMLMLPSLIMRSNDGDDIANCNEDWGGWSTAIIIKQVFIIELFLVFNHSNIILESGYRQWNAEFCSCGHYKIILQIPCLQYEKVTLALWWRLKNLILLCPQRKGSSQPLFGCVDNISSAHICLGPVTSPHWSSNISTESAG